MLFSWAVVGNLVLNSRAAVYVSVTDPAPWIFLRSPQILPDKLDGILQLYSVTDFLASWIPELHKLLKDPNFNSCFLCLVPF